MRLTNYKDAFLMKDFFSLDFVKDLGITNEMVPMKKKRGWEQKQRLCRNVYATFLQLVIDEIIEQDAIFYAPGLKRFRLHIKKKRAVDLMRIYKNPKIYKDVDMITTNGAVFSLWMYAPSLRFGKEWEVRLPRKTYARIIEKGNQGFHFVGRRKANYQGLKGLLSKEFPTLSKSILQRILVEGSRVMVSAMDKRKPILLMNKRCGLRIYIYQPNTKLLMAMAYKDNE